MADAEKKGLTVKIDADLHAEVRQYKDLPKKLKTHKNEKSFLDRFKVVEGDEAYRVPVMETTGLTCG